MMQLETDHARRKPLRPSLVFHSDLGESSWFMDIRPLFDTRLFLFLFLYVIAISNKSHA